MLVIAALLSASLWAYSVEDARGTLDEQWRFTFETNANPSTPDSNTSSSTDAQATVDEGLYGFGWADSLPNFGGRQGYWDLGAGGKVTVEVPEPAHSVLSQQISLSVDYFQDRSPAPPVVNVLNAQIVGKPVVEAVDTGPRFGNWYRIISTWRANVPGPQKCVIAADDAASLPPVVDEIIVQSASRLLPGDANLDCVVNIIDLIVVRNHLNEDTTVGGNWQLDLNADSRINILDMLVIRAHLNNSCP